MSYPVSVGMVTLGCNSVLPCTPSRSKSHSSKHVSLLKSASTAPDLVPVTIHGAETPGDQANAAVLGISRSRTMVGR